MCSSFFFIALKHIIELNMLTFIGIPKIERVRYMWSLERKEVLDVSARKK